MCMYICIHTDTVHQRVTAAAATAAAAAAAGVVVVVVVVSLFRWLLFSVGVVLLLNPATVLYVLTFTLVVLGDAAICTLNGFMSSCVIEISIYSWQYIIVIIVIIVMIVIIVIIIVIIIKYCYYSYYYYYIYIYVYALCLFRYSDMYDIQIP